MEFEKLFETQLGLQRRMGLAPYLISGETAVKENGFALMVEVTELLECINWKFWRRRQLAPDWDKAKGELVDALLFWVNMANAAGLTAQELDARVTDKWTVINRRIDDGY